MAILDIYCNATLVGTLTEEAHNGVFTYLPGTSPDNIVSLLMPVRSASYVWPGGIMPAFQMNLPEGFNKQVIRHRFGPQADMSDMGLLALTGADHFGRVRAIPHGSPLESVASNLDIAALLASQNSRENLMLHLATGTVKSTPGANLKALAFSEDSAITWTDEFILKAGPTDMPGATINEYLCLEVARHTNLEVPETCLSEDGQVLAIRRSDVTANGTRVGIEDFCALKGFDPARRYQGTIEDLAILSNQYLGVDHRKDSKRKMFLLLLLNYALRNAQAHLRHYALTYTNQRDARFSPVYNIATSTVYPQYLTEPPALPLRGKRLWRSGKALFDFGGARLGLSPTDMNAALEQVVDAVQKVRPLVSSYAQRYPDFREIGARMLETWAVGLEDIKPNAKP
ncbi:type II toxin-antitoxin system HipA family toxin [Paraburkholderia tropica]|uniref:type II toxin-antitoxin system HipA family toxin n=1 Tax=Paraburkholderia tropica TaxID=92647 RepID=UPI00158FFD41|nr:type II toxin-antitoxin system HipA family toxin [Paraburkholderia tropica]